MRLKLGKSFTVSHVLYDSGHISPKDFVAEKVYNAYNVPNWGCWLYGWIIIPVVAVMKISSRFTNYVHPIARSWWIDNAIVEGHKILKDRQKRKRLEKLVGVNHE